MNRRDFFKLLGIPLIVFPSVGLSKREARKDRLLIGNCTKCWQSQVRFPFGKDDSAIPYLMEVHMRKGACSCGGNIDKWIIINEFGFIIDVDIKTYKYAYPK